MDDFYFPINNGFKFKVDVWEEVVFVHHDDDGDESDGDDDDDEGDDDVDDDGTK